MRYESHLRFKEEKTEAQVRKELVEFGLELTPVRLQKLGFFFF